MLAGCYCVRGVCVSSSTRFSRTAIFLFSKCANGHAHEERCFPAWPYKVRAGLQGACVRVYHTDRMSRYKLYILCKVREGG